MCRAVQGPGVDSAEIYWSGALCMVMGLKVSSRRPYSLNSNFIIWGLKVSLNLNPIINPKPASTCFVRPRGNVAGDNLRSRGGDKTVCGIAKRSRSPKASRQPGLVYGFPKLLESLYIFTIYSLLWIMRTFWTSCMR